MCGANTKIMGQTLKMQDKHFNCGTKTKNVGLTLKT